MFVLAELGSIAFGNARPGRLCFKTAVIPTAAPDRQNTVDGGIDDAEMADFRRAAKVACVDVPVQDQPSADAVAHRHPQKIIEFPGFPEFLLGQGTGIDIVFNGNRSIIETGRKNIDDGKITNPGKTSVNPHAGDRVGKAGNGDADPLKVGGAQLRNDFFDDGKANVEIGEKLGFRTYLTDQDEDLRKVFTDRGLL